MLRVRVLGELEVEGSDGPIELGGSWRASSLLAWLALHPGSHLRSELAPRFWPEILDASARASLRNSLWAIRRTLGPDAESLLTTRERVGLAPEVWVDAAAFADHVAAGELDEALELARGDLLAGIDEEWVHEHRDAHREALSELLERLAERAESDGDPAEALDHSKRRVGLDPLDEEAQRALIARLAAAGDRAGALAAYGKVRDRLRSELGISVSAETRELAHRIREGDEPRGPAGGAEPESRRREPAPPGAGHWNPGSEFPLPPRLRHRARSAFIGRDRELAKLRELWAAARGGDGARLVLLDGDSGIGKTRLAREIAIEAAGSGAIVLQGAADEDLLVPHQPLVTAFDHYLSVASEAELERRVQPRLADLAPIAPGVQRDGGEAVAGSTESRRYRLFESVASLLAELSTEAGVLLVIDDLQWADQSTAAILRHVFESRPEIALAVVATQRSPDGSGPCPAAEEIERLHRGGFIERIEIRGLPHADVALLAEAIGGSELPDELVRSISEETSGNPFFIQEVVGDLSESGGAAALAIDRATVPARVREVLNHKLERLDDGCVRMLTVAAVVGTDFALAPLERVSDLEGDDLTAALDDAAAANVIVEDEGAGGETFSFAHALLRRTLLERLTNARRRRIHARIAEALETTEGEEALLEIAHHLCEARPVSDREKTLDYATRAATRATENLAYAEAVDLFTRARLLLPEGDERRRTLALKRAVAYQALFHAVMDSPA